MDLSIIIVNYKSKDFLRKCIISIHQSSLSTSYEIIVVDGGSFDGCELMLSTEFPTVRFIQCANNIGFSKCNNLGFKHSCGEYILFLNPDTEIIGQAIVTLRNAINDCHRAGIVGAHLLNTDRTVQTSCIQSYPTIVNLLLDSNLLRRMFPRLSLWGIMPLHSTSISPSSVEVISGACIMLKRSTFVILGKFSQDYFLYAEDLDLCFKSHISGYLNYYVPCAQVIHHGGGSSQNTKNHFSTVMMSESVFRFLKKFRGVFYAYVFRLLLFAFAILRLLVLLSIFPFAYISGVHTSIIISTRKWYYILKWTIGCESWALNYK